MRAVQSGSGMQRVSMHRATTPCRMQQEQQQQSCSVPAQQRSSNATRSRRRRHGSHPEHRWPSRLRLSCHSASLACADSRLLYDTSVGLRPARLISLNRLLTCGRGSKEHQAAGCANACAARAEQRAAGDDERQLRACRCSSAHAGCRCRMRRLCLYGAFRQRAPACMHARSTPPLLCVQALAHVLWALAAQAGGHEDVVGDAVGPHAQRVGLELAKQLHSSVPVVLHDAVVVA